MDAADLLPGEERLRDGALFHCLRDASLTGGGDAFMAICAEQNAGRLPSATA